MQVEALIDLVAKIKRCKCEFQTVEVKTAEGGCPKLYDTLSSFSNQESGGVIVLGLREKNKATNNSDFATVGVYDVQDIQQKVAAQCLQMEPEVRPLFTVAEIEGKFIVGVEVPAVDVTDRPVFYRGAGRQQGSYVRVGDADFKMTEYEIYSYEAFRRRVRDDIREVENARLDLLCEDKIKEYLTAVRESSENLARINSDNEILELMGILKNGVPTLSGVMVFGKYPQAYFPQLDITAVVVPGTEMGDIGVDGERFIANRRINGTITEMLTGAVEFVKRNMRVKTVIDENGERKDKPEFPIKAVREVVLNALVHRDYSIHTEGTPIMICMYQDRMEIINKGGLYGRMTIDKLGKDHPETRNPALANILEIMKETENRFSGIPTIRREMKEAGLPEPEFSVQSGEFKVILKNNFESATVYQQQSSHAGIAVNVTEKERKLLEYCREPRSRDEIISYMRMSRYHVMSNYVKGLLERGLLKLTLPELPQSPKQKYYYAE